MQIQKSFNSQQATLFLVSTPIGNLSDMTPRAVATLQAVALIASEDTRVTRKLCTHFEITTPLTSYHEHNKNTKTAQIIERLAAGDDVALVSDAGMPLISDPGDQLVELALAAGYAVVPIPGANAALTALVASGLIPQPFLFYGFLDRHKKRRHEELSQLKTTPATLIFYESPHRLAESIKSIIAILGNRQIVIARELTKKFEEFIRGSAAEILAHMDEIKGEVVLLVDGNHAAPEIDAWWEVMTLTEHVEHYIDEGFKTNAAIKQVATDLKRSRQDVYKEYHHDED